MTGVQVDLVLILSQANNGVMICNKSVLIFFTSELGLGIITLFVWLFVRLA